MADSLRRTGLHDLHVREGAKMVPFVGWDMPVSYTLGVLGEHLHTRTHASLFDVGHMGQVRVVPEDGQMATAALALESLIPADILGLEEGRQRYGLFTEEEGGILDDLMIANRGDHFLLVVNAGRAADDIAHLRRLAGVRIEPVTDRGLIAVQGPKAEAVLSRILPEVRHLRFMDVRTMAWQGVDLWVTRGGYTGEDGFEISVPDSHLVGLTEAVLAHPEMAPAGLGARDSLRLEAGLPLYGQDMDQDVSPSEAAVDFAIPKVRRRGGAREGVELFDAELGGRSLGRVRSGGFGPSIGAPVAVALLDPALPDGTRIWAELRGKRVPVLLAPLPFVKPSYKR